MGWCSILLSTNTRRLSSKSLGLRSRSALEGGPAWELPAILHVSPLCLYARGRRHQRSLDRATRFEGGTRAADRPGVKVDAQSEAIDQDIPVQTSSFGLRRRLPSPDCVSFHSLFTYVQRADGNGGGKRDALKAESFCLRRIAFGVIARQSTSSLRERSAGEIPSESVYRPGVAASN